ncbi:MAG: DUF6262 family protein [Acidimicrobiales bacterium]
MQADNSRHLIAAARRRTGTAQRNAAAALRRMDASGIAVSFEAVATEAGVSRSWLYTQPELRAEIERLRQRHSPSPDPTVPLRQRASEASLLRRLEVANERIRDLQAENARLRAALAESLGTNRATRKG